MTTVAREAVLDTVKKHHAPTGSDANDNAPRLVVAPGEPTFATLRELLANPTNVNPPIEVAHRIAYEARALLVCGPDKSGKSTFVANGVAAVSRGRSFIGRPTFRGRGLWVGLEENIGDAVARFQELDADPDQIELAIAKPATLVQEILDRLTRETFVWVVVDSVAEFARIITRGTPPSEGDSSAWSNIARPLVAIAHDRGVALTALHHVRRDGEERGSTELFAAFDGVLVMSGSKKGDEDERSRHFRVRARRGIDQGSFSVSWDGSDYHIVGSSEVSLDARVLLQIQAKPGLSGSKLRQLVGRRGKDVDEAIEALRARGAIRNNGGLNGAAWVPAGVL